MDYFDKLDAINITECKNILRKIINGVGYDKKESFINEDIIKHYLREEINNDAIRLFGVFYVGF